MRLFSGIQPSGDPHLGNYLGAIKNWVALQEKYESIFCVVDLHAITVPQDAKKLKAKIRQTAGLLIAAGIDPEKSPIFIQSHVSAHSELAWILNCFLPLGWMERMTQFKDKSKQHRERVSMGLFDYPALMAADILLYQTDVVPVGEDQKQHVELTRDVAERFNNIYGPIFKIPEALIAPSGARIMSLKKPTEKMSKSDEDPQGVINLLDVPEEIEKKIMAATTDSKKEIKFDKNRHGIANLLVIYELLSGLTRPEIEKRFAGQGYAEFKKELAELVIEHCRPLQKRYQELTADSAYLDSILIQGADKVRPWAEKTLKIVKEKMGLG